MFMGKKKHHFAESERYNVTQNKIFTLVYKNVHDKAHQSYKVMENLCESL